MLKVVPQTPAPVFGVVLSQDTVSRLDMLNTAARALRELGYRVIREELFPKSGDCPEIEIQRDEKPIGPLLDRTRDRLWFEVEGCKRCRATFAGIKVTWREAQS